ncbi:MAG: DUF6655 family protein [Phycisphaerae bacterium]|nr:DUF6655 family protein [Tepidisphaeraceae bacterium]
MTVRLPLLLLLLLPAVGSTGCATIRVTDPARTATEQFLLSQAITQSISQLNVDALRDRKVFVDPTYLAGAEQIAVQGELRQRLFTSPEQSFATAEFREKLLIAGARLVHERKDADVVVELRAGGMSIDRLDNLVGLPATVLSQGETGGVPIGIPEVALYKNTRQRGFAGLSYVAFRNDTGEYVTSSGPYIGRTLRDDFWLFGMGPRTVGNIPPTQNPK